MRESAPIPPKKLGNLQAPFPLRAGRECGIMGLTFNLKEET